MSPCRYVILDPTGNLTALVLDPVAPKAEASLTEALLKFSEQVAYLEPPILPGAEAAIRLMGGADNQPAGVRGESACPLPG